MILDEIVKVDVGIVGLELRDGRELRMSRTDQHDNQFDSAKLPRAERDGADVGLFVSWDDLSNERKNVRD